MSEQKLTPEKLKKILTVITVIIVAVLILTGKSDLGALLGLNEAQEGSSAAEGSVPFQTAGSAEETAEAFSSAAETKEAEPSSEVGESSTETRAAEKTYRFRSSSYLNQHYDKHGKEMGFASAAEYEAAASAVINNPLAEHKTEKEDGDFVYYIEATNEFVILSKDGYIRTYFLPSAGKAYYDRQ